MRKFPGEVSDSLTDNLIIDELLVLLQEKRTALAMIRTGIAILISQITIIGILIATSKLYAWIEVLHLMFFFILLNFIALGIACYFIFGSLKELQKLDRQVLIYKKNHSTLASFLDE